MNVLSLKKIAHPTFFVSEFRGLCDLGGRLQGAQACHALQRQARRFRFVVSR